MWLTALKGTLEFFVNLFSMPSFNYDFCDLLSRKQLQLQQQQQYDYISNNCNNKSY